MEQNNPPVGQGDIQGNVNAAANPQTLAEVINTLLMQNNNLQQQLTNAITQLTAATTAANNAAAAATATGGAPPAGVTTPPTAAPAVPTIIIDLHAGRQPYDLGQRAARPYRLPTSLCTIDLQGRRIQ
jgi:CheY-specific phosphatase CheX